MNLLKTPKGRLLLMSMMIAFAAGGCKSTGPHESTGAYMSDTTITSKVKTKMLANKEVSGTAVNVETYKGTVQLSGFVKSDQERQKAVELARSVDGVKDVKNDIQLR